MIITALYNGLDSNGLDCRDGSIISVCKSVVLNVIIDFVKQIVKVMRMVQVFDSV